jgi:hypothetical protein
MGLEEYGQRAMGRFEEDSEEDSEEDGGEDSEEL